MKVGVLALQGSVAAHSALLSEAGAEPVAVRDTDALAEVSALLIPGGESTTMWRVAVRTKMLEPLRAAVAGGMPTFGSCAGMVMLADRLLDGAAGQQTLGGLDVTVRRNAFGRQVDSFEAALDVPALGSAPFPGVFIRAPWVTEVGPGVEVLATVDDRIVAVRQGVLLATSFHPELTSDPRLHQLFVETAERRGLARTA